jgi:hypothetical protein
MKTLAFAILFLSLSTFAFADGLITTINPNTGEIQSYGITQFGPNQWSVLDNNTGQQWHGSRLPTLDEWAGTDKDHGARGRNPLFFEDHDDCDD